MSSDREPEVIVVGTDGSEPARLAAATAIEIAAARGDGIIFVTAWRELRGDFGIPLHKLVPDLLDIEREWATKVGARALTSAEEAGVDAEAVVLHGRAAEAICSVARERHAHLIVVGSHGWGAVGGMLFGSVANSVVRGAPCPVLVVPESRGSSRPASATREPLRLVM